VEQELSVPGVVYDIVEVRPGADFMEIGRQTVLRAKQSGGIVAAAGGDGTINTVAGLCCDHGVTLGVIPAGTFNYFARDLGIPSEPTAAARLLLDGKTEQVSVGYVNDRIFLNNASFGLYSKLIRNRENHKAKFGRFRLVAAYSAVVSLLRGIRPFTVHLRVGNEMLLRRTTMVFVSNNLLQLAKLDTKIAEATPEDGMAVFILRPTSRLDMLRLLLRGAFRQLANDPYLETFCIDKFDTDTNKHHVDVVVDGEIVRCKAPLSFRVAPRALNVIVPADKDANGHPDATGRQSGIASERTAKAAGDAA
jgi:diacylglycerol kinase family enzyme